MLKNHIITMLRNLWKYKSFSALNIFGLGIGIACAGLIFLWVEDEVSYDTMYVKRDRICQLMTNQTYDGVTRTFWSTPGVLAGAVKAEIPGVVNSARASRTKLLFSVGDKDIYQQGIYADSAFMDIFMPVNADGAGTIGRQALPDPQAIVISEKMARQYFGGPHAAIGQRLTADNKDQYRVTAVFKDLPDNSTMQYDWIIPFSVFAKTRDWLKYWGANAPQTYIELSPGANIEAVRRQAAGIIHAKDPDNSNQVVTLPMKDWRLRNNFVAGKQTGGRIEFVRLFAIIAWIILVIACINFMNLSTARSEKRAREVGVRKVLGAAKGSLVGQFMGEALAMSLFSIVLGVILIVLSLPFFNLLIEKQLTLGLGNPLHLGALVFICLFCGLVAGSYPSLYLSSFNPIYVFKGLRMREGSASMIRQGLVVFQFTVSIVLIISTVIVYQQVQHVRNRDLGYNKEHLLDMKLTGTLQADFERVRRDLIGTGAVENAALCGAESIYTADNSSNYSWDGKDPNSNILISHRPISAGYVSTMGMKLVEGRNFYENIKADSTSVMITEALAKLMGKGSPIGKVIRENDDPYTVVGVVKDYLYGDFYGHPDPVIFFAKPQNTSYLYVRTKDGVPADEALAKIGAVIKKDNPAYPFTYTYVSEQFDTVFKSEMLIGDLSRIFSALAILISCLGLFGLAAYTAERRVKEIGIRKVLGASAARVAGLLSKDFLKLVAISCLVAFPLAWWAMHHWLQNFAYHIRIEWWVFLLAGVVAILIAMVTVSSQAIKAALMNPVKSLKRD